MDEIHLRVGILAGGALEGECGAQPSTPSLLFVITRGILKIRAASCMLNAADLLILNVC